VEPTFKFFGLPMAESLPVPAARTPTHCGGGSPIRSLDRQCLFTVAPRVLLVWIYNNTGKSVFAETVCHAMSNVRIFLPNYGSYYDPRFSGLTICGNVDRQPECGHPEITLISKKENSTARPTGGQSTLGRRL